MNDAAIHAWLAAGQDYAQGAALYAQLGGSAVYKRLFALPPTASSRQVLVRELSGLVAPVAPKAAPVVPTPAAPTVVPASGLDSPLLAKLAQQLKAVRDERSHLHPQLTASGMTKVRRLKLCARIAELTDQEVLLLAHQAYVQQHGRLPGPVPLAEVTDTGELRQRLDNLRSRRSKLKKDPAKETELAQVQADIDLITTKFKR